jgi:hypothetical protein
MSIFPSSRYEHLIYFKRGCGLYADVDVKRLTSGALAPGAANVGAQY